jgi:hypothetical protein
LGVLFQADRCEPLGDASHGIQTPRAFLQPVTRSPLVARGLSALLIEGHSVPASQAELHNIELAMIGQEQICNL